MKNGFSLSRALRCNGLRTLSVPFPHVAATFSDLQFGGLRTGSSVFIQGAAATPEFLISQMTKVALERGLRNIKTIHMHLDGTGPMPPERPELHGVFKPTCLFTGANMRSAVNSGFAGYVPVFLCEIPSLFRRGIYRPDVSLVQVSPPDRHGYCSLGTSVDVTVAALEVSKTIIGQVNSHVPRTLGDGIIHISKFDEIIHHDAPIFETSTGKSLSKEELAIGKLIADELIVDGATLQLGIGNIPDAVLSCLHDHQDLGVHTEMFSDGILPLVEKGIINNSKKVEDNFAGKIVTSFAVGSRKLYDFIDDNQAVAFLDVEFVNNPSTVGLLPNMTAINSCVEIDLTGQVSSDSIGEKIYSGFGGQVDFIRGASISRGGKPIIALPSRTHKGESRIVPNLKPGAGVVTTRGHVHYVVTEYGIANLYGRTLQERAQMLINIAHPDDREMLDKMAYARFGGEAYRAFLSNK